MADLMQAPQSVGPPAAPVPDAGTMGAPPSTPNVDRPSGLPIGMTEADFEAQQDENAVSPEEQEQYNQFVVKALQMLYSPKAQTAAINQMNRHDLTVPEAVGNATATIAHAVVAQAKAAKVDLSPDVVFHAAADYIVPNLFEIADAAGIFPKGADQQQQMNMAFLEAQKAYGEKYALNSPDAPELQKQAQDVYAQKVAQEVDEGKANPRRLVAAMAGNTPVGQAVSQAIRETNHGK